jgi:hypothetical protein
LRQRKQKLLAWCCSDEETAKEGEATSDNCKTGTISKIYVRNERKTKITEK